MSFRRRIEWNTAMQDLRADRAPQTSGFLSARSFARVRLESARRAVLEGPLIIGGKINRSALMRRALASARVQRLSQRGHPWFRLMGSSLRFEWARAKTALAQHRDADKRMTQR
jgi:hypothetical protein